jgi:hypothetical protein
MYCGVFIDLEYEMKIGKSGKSGTVYSFPCFNEVL